MKIKLIRSASNEGCTLGALLVDGAFFCHTLEDVAREVPGAPVESWKVPGDTAIPQGAYTVIIDHSAHFQRELPHILNVPGFEGIRIHSGNKAADTEGCILVGDTISSPSMIGMSHVAFERLFALIEQAYVVKEPITIEVI